MGKVELLKYESLYRDFIDEEFRVKGENECFFRDNHVKNLNMAGDILIRTKWIVSLKTVILPLTGLRSW